jgi:hypothetical protein
MKPIKIFWCIFVLTIGISCLLCRVINASDDDLDKKSKAGTFTYGSTYTAETLKKSQSVMDQSISWSTTVEEAQKAVQADLSKAVDEKAVDKVNPELKKKTGGGEATGKNSTQTQLIDSTQYDVIISHGDKGSQIYENGRLIAERFGGVLHVYVGFSNAGYASNGTLTPIQQAIDYASSNGGGIIIVSGGSYIGNNLITLRSNVKLLGGYNDAGVRDITNNSSIITGNLYLGEGLSNIEINGFTIYGSHWQGCIYGYNTSNLKVANNTFNIAAGITTTVNGVSLWNGGSFLVNNNVFNTTGGVVINNDESLHANPNMTGMVEGNLFNNDVRGLAIGGTITEHTNITSANNNFLRGESGISMAHAIVTSNNDYFNFDRTALRYKRVVYQAELKTLSSASRPNEQRVDDTKIEFKIPLSPDGSPIINLKDNKPNISQEIILTIIPGDAARSDPIGPMFKELLLSKDSILDGKTGDFDKEEIAKIVDAVINRSALALPASDATKQKSEYIQIALLIAKMIKTPTEEQKAMLDAAQALINDIEEMNKDVNDQKTVNEEAECLQVISAVFLAQALPDLLNENDMATIKGAFKEIDDMRNAIVSKYKDAVKPYYDAMKKEMMTNIEALQDKDMLAREMTKEAILKLSPKEMDQIIKRVKDNPDKTQGEKDMLSLETKLKAEYIEPNQKVLRIEMKAMMNRLTKKLYSILYETGLVKPM